ncbi:MAG: ABC transporter ATP-binding protein [Candidatus Hydrogenedentes bacterium]|nr:ABC transporter ATP-binding protein [Candidatus Hydrogenedentota bacterium]
MLFGRRGLAGVLRGDAREFSEVLRGITFKIEAGESFGVIGPNGSGKSTLLKILAGVTAPSSGRIEIRGRVASLLELGAGFHPLLTGRENVYLNGRILGMSRADVNRVFDHIVAFSGIGEFIDNPVETYSSGMYVRLGFSVAVHANPDIFLVDEVLAVGDEEFQRKCRQRIIELREQGKTIIFVSHDLGLVNALCDHVLLLGSGQVISRGTPQQTIDYYLRQTGTPQEKHTFACGGLDAVFARGRLSLYRDNTELTAPCGLQAEVYSMERCHLAHEADWRVVERGPAHCLAHGRMTRMPMTHIWEMRLEENKLVWDFSVECERPVPISVFNANLYFPSVYTEWLYGELAGEFPEVLPTDLAWNLMANSVVLCHSAALLTRQGSPYPPVDVRLETQLPNVRLLMFNGDYVSGTRVLQANAVLPASQAQFPAGRTRLVTLHFDLGASEDALRRRIGMDHSIQAGSLNFRFDSGALHIMYGDTEITKGNHVYASMLVGRLWNDSGFLQWGPVASTADRISVTGVSRRFPFRLRWEFHSVQNGMRVELRMEVLEALDVEEYQVSVMLAPEYAHWETEFEAGAFPDVPPGQEDWQHLNRNYEPGKRISAQSPSHPRITLHSAAPGRTPRMTPINASHIENARAIQALFVPGRTPFHFEPGEHVLFDGVIAIEA